MASAIIREFLESSTIHGLVHISTAKSGASRAAWAAIVVACFAVAISMITNSYKEWQESPVSTTITTHPINELDFPTVTVCPPRGSNTALNHLLEKVKDVNFTQREKKELLKISREVFIEIPNKNHAQKMTDLLSVENIRSIANGRASMPDMDEQGLITIRSSEPEGTFKTPCFGDSDCNKEFHRKPHFFHYVLDLTDDIVVLVGEGALVLSIHTEGNFLLQENRLQLYNDQLKAPAAEQFCVSRGGHLASIGSQEEQDQIEKVANGNWVWLGAKKKEGGWQWLDNRTWEYQYWGAGNPTNCPDCDCILMWDDGSWGNTLCTFVSSFICVNPPTRRFGNHTVFLRKSSLMSPTFHFWWNHTLDKRESKVPGFKLSWHVENGSLPDLKEFVSKDLEGSVSTPGLGSQSPPNYNKERHEYTTVIELPYNITEVIGDGALVVDINVTIPDNQQEGSVELQTTELTLEYNKNTLTGEKAEAFCISKGGHLASASTPEHWQRLQSFIAERGLYDESIWLGGTYAGRKWAWTDGSKWSEEHWRDEYMVFRGSCLSVLQDKWSDEDCEYFDVRCWIFDV